MVQHCTDQESGIRQNAQFTDQLGSGNPGHRVKRPDVLCNGEEPSREQEQVKNHVVMVGSWPCIVSSEVHINGRRISDPVWEDKGKAMVPKSEDEKDPKRTSMVLSKDREVVKLGYSRMSRDDASVANRGGESGNPNRFDRCHTRFLCQNQVLIICMTQYQLFHTHDQKCSQITKCHE
jgi:hypothetical protein